MNVKQNYFDHDDIISDATAQLWTCALCSFLGEGVSETKLLGQHLGMNAKSVILFPWYIWLKKISRNKNFQGQGARSRVTRPPWHFRDRNSVNFSRILMKQKQKCRAYLWLCYYGNQDSVSRPVFKLVGDRILTAILAVVQLNYI